MKLYKIHAGLLIEHNNTFYLHADTAWDVFINDDNLYDKVAGLTGTLPPVPAADAAGMLESVQAPIGSQELWACGVTYYRSKVGRQEESKTAGGGDFYGRVYDAERPEVFFKATPHRVVGHNGKVNIRKDSTWDVPEPELTLVVTSSGRIVGYTIGNDMSSRSIEGENPLYLPQAKTYDACASVGPCVYVAASFPAQAIITLEIVRQGRQVFNESIGVDQMKRTPEELVSFVYRECTFPHGSLIMTGTGIVPPADFTLRSADEIRITISSIGTLVNVVR